MKHRVWWDTDNACARLVLVDEFTTHDVAPAVEAIAVLVEANDRYRLVIDHSGHPGALSREVREQLERHAAHVARDKLAFYGLTPLNRMVARVVVGLQGLADRTRFFKSEDEALAWIREE